MSPKRFRIAFSFAGEKRDFVSKVVALLAERFGEDAILYDKFYEARFARSDLGIHLPDLYHKESDLVVLVICEDYETKDWCGLEWTAIHALIKERKVEDVMLCRFDHSLIKGLYSTAGFVQLDHKTPEEAAHLILERLADQRRQAQGPLHQSRVTPAAPVLSTSIPHNLPTLQPFFGREDELKKIADALDPDSRTWGALIDGPGGMGKTSLAVRAAYDASPDVFKRIIFISLKTRELDDDGVRDLSGFILSGLVELLNELARELGCDDIAKAPEDQRPRLLLDALRGTQTLLVLDNLESLTQARARHPFHLRQKTARRLQGHPHQPRTHRLRRGGTHPRKTQPGGRARHPRRTRHAQSAPRADQRSRAPRPLPRDRGKPLLLRWTAGQLGRGHCLTFTDALHFIRSCPEGNDPLEFIFGDLVEDFSEMEMQVISALTYFTLPAKVEHIAEIVGSSPRVLSRQAIPGDATPSTAPVHDEAPDREGTRGLQSFAAVELALRSLANRSLAVPTDELKTFTLVPMVADFLRKKKPEVVAETGDRLQQRAYALIMENGEDNYDRFPTLEAAWPGIAPALSLFLAGGNARLQNVCAALSKFLHFQGRWDEWLALCEKAEAKAVAASDGINAAAHAYHAGVVHELRRQADAVIACADRANEHFARANAGARSLALVILLRGTGHMLKKDYSAAVAAFHESLAMLRGTAADSSDLVAVLNALARAERLSGNFTAAANNSHEALRLARTDQNAEAIATCSVNLCAAALIQKDWTVAETLAREALSFSIVVHRQQLIARSSYCLAYALACQGKAAEALPHAQFAVEIYTHLGLPDLAAAQAIVTECEAALDKK
jgi:tetratricopeptide (TPR) repeat protein